MAAVMPALLVSLILAVTVVLAFPATTLPARRLLRSTTGSTGHSPGSDGSSMRVRAGFFRSGNRRAQSSGIPAGLSDPAMVLELVAAMLEAGSGLGRALELVAMVATEDIRSPLRPVVSALAIGADWDTAWRSSSVRHPDVRLLRDALGFAAHTGAPSASILYAQAARIRRDRFRRAEKRAAALGVKLVIPLGLCSLPAFICLGVVPVLLALVPSGG